MMTIHSHRLFDVALNATRDDVALGVATDRCEECGDVIPRAGLCHRCREELLGDIEWSRRQDRKHEGEIQ